MAGSDDIITLGGARKSARERDEAIEELFHAEYPRLVQLAFERLGDEDLAGQVAAGAFLTLWQRWRRVSDPRGYLQLAMTSQVREAGGRGGSQDGAGVGAELLEVDTATGWREFEELRARGSALRRRNLQALAAVAAVAAVAVGFLTLANRGQADHGGRAPRQPVAVAPARYPAAIVARYDLSGVISVVGDSGRAWAIRQVPKASSIEQPAFATTYQLVAIDLRTNEVLYRIKLGGEPEAVAAGGGRVWLTTPLGEGGGQIIRIDPATGRTVQKLHLRAGRCSQLSFGFGRLYAACTAWPVGTGIWTINPASGRAWLVGTVRGFTARLIAAPDAVWYVRDYMRIRGFWRTGSPIAVRWEPVAAHTPAYYGISAGSANLAYDLGSIWALGSQERTARIDAVNGKVVRTFTFRNYDPTRAGGLDFLTASGGWLWILDNGYPFSGVLRVSEATGLPAGGVPIPPGSCGQAPCSLIFATPGSIWVPTAELLLRIDQSALPVAPTGQPVNHFDADSSLPG